MARDTGRVSVNTGKDLAWPHVCVTGGADWQSDTGIIARNLAEPDNRFALNYCRKRCQL